MNANVLVETETTAKPSAKQEQKLNEDRLTRFTLFLQIELYETQSADKADR